MRLQKLMSDPALEASLVAVTLLVGLWAAWLGHSIRRELEAHDRAWNDHLRHSELMARYANAFGDERAFQKKRLVLVARIALGVCSLALLAQIVWGRPL